MLLLHSIYSNHIYECEATKWEKRLYGGKKLRLSGKTSVRRLSGKCDFVENATKVRKNVIYGSLFKGTTQIMFHK